MVYSQAQALVWFFQSDTIQCYICLLYKHILHSILIVNIPQSILYWIFSVHFHTKHYSIHTILVLNIPWSFFILNIPKHILILNIPQFILVQTFLNTFSYGIIHSYKHSSIHSYTEHSSIHSYTEHSSIHSLFNLVPGKWSRKVLEHFPLIPIQYPCASIFILDLFLNYNILSAILYTKDKASRRYSQLSGPSCIQFVPDSQDSVTLTCICPECVRTFRPLARTFWSYKDRVSIYNAVMCPILLPLEPSCDDLAAAEINRKRTLWHWVHYGIR